MLQGDDRTLSETTKQLRVMIEDQLQKLQSTVTILDLLQKFVNSGLELLNYEARDYNPKYKIIGLIILDCLLDPSDENASDRRVEIASSLRKIFENERISVEQNETLARLVFVKHDVMWIDLTSC
jgi:hypothetical protein